MPKVYVEPRPKGRPDGSAIDHYVLELDGDVHVPGSQAQYRTQEMAIEDAKRLGHNPHVARVRDTKKGQPDHWRPV